MSAPFVSVLITTCNYGPFIEEAIDSVLTQDFASDQLEVVVVDDGSTDDTAERVKKYDSRVRYFYKPNGGQASALNLGFENARGEIVSLLDGDDFFLPGKLALVGEAFRRDPGLGMVYHPMQEWNVRTNQRRLTEFPLISGSPFEDISKFMQYAGQGTCMSFRRRFLQRLLPIPGQIRMLADAYPGNLIVFVAPVLALSECLSVYRVHGKNSYQVDESRMPIETRKSRLRLWQVVVHEMGKWLVREGYIRKEPFARYFLHRWKLYLASEEFLITPPGRFRFFWCLVRENRALSVIQTWKLTALRYVTALPAVVLGYDRRYELDHWRCRVVEKVDRLAKKFQVHRTGAWLGQSRVGRFRKKSPSKL